MDGFSVCGMIGGSLLDSVVSAMGGRRGVVAGAGGAVTGGG